MRRVANWTLSTPSQIEGHNRDLGAKSLEEGGLKTCSLALQVVEHGLGEHGEPAFEKDDKACCLAAM